MNVDEVLEELLEDGYIVPVEDTAAYKTLLEAMDRAYKLGELRA